MHSGAWHGCGQQLLVRVWCGMDRLRKRCQTLDKQLKLLPGFVVIALALTAPIALAEVSTSGLQTLFNRPYLLSGGKLDPGASLALGEGPVHLLDVALVWQDRLCISPTRRTPVKPLAGYKRRETELATFGVLRHPLQFRVRSS